METRISVCLNCQYENRSIANFCGSCGLPISRTCTQCNTDNPSSYQFCDACGAPLERVAQATVGMQGDYRPATVGRGVSFRHEKRPTPKPRRTVRLIGLNWDTQAPRWLWSRAYFRSWALRNKWELLSVALLTILAAFLRVYRLGDIPNGFHGDEAWNGIDALRILKDGWIGVYTPAALGNMAGAIYLTAVSVWLFDASIFAVRLSMALFGIAAVPATHLLLRLGFGRWVALIGTFALTFSYLHLHFSRIGLQLVSLPFVAVLAAAALLWAMRSRSRWSWLVAGALWGLVPYTYLAFPAFMASLVAALAVYVFLRRDQFRLLLAPLGLFAMGALIFALPLLGFVLNSHEVFLERMKLASVVRSHEFPEAGSLADKTYFFAERAWEALTSFVSNPRYDGVDGTGGAGALDFGIGTLVYIGLAMSIKRWRSPPYLLALLVVISAMATQIVSDPSSGMMRRSLVALPFALGLAGVGAVAIVGLVERLVKNGGRTVAMAGLVLILLGSGVWNLRYYFGELTHSQTFKFTFAPDHIDGLAAAHSFDDPGTIYFYSGRWSFTYESVRFLYPDSRGINRSRELGIFDLERLDDGPVTYLLVGDYGLEIDRLRELYPGGETIIDEEPQPRFIVYHLRS